MTRFATALFVLTVCAACTRSHADDATIVRADLASMRHAIAQYRLQQGHPPRKLDDLVAAHLLPTVPVDPITGSATTWKTDTEETVAVNEDFREPVRARGGAPAAQGIIDVHSRAPATPGIIDVHSGAPGRDDNGKAWAEY